MAARNPSDVLAIAGADAGVRPPHEVGIQLLDARTTGDGQRLARFAIAVDSPLFSGHFPGRPLLPGVVQLALVTWTLAAGSPAGGSPAAASAALCQTLEDLRLRRLVHPGDTLDVRLAAPADDGTLRFQISCQGETVTRGSGRWLPGSGFAAPAATRDSAQARGAAASIAAADATASADAAHPACAPAARHGAAGRRLADPSEPQPPLLPHGAPARLVRQVLAAAPGEIACACEIPADHPLAAGGRAPGYLGLEAAAQAAGALAGMAGMDRMAGMARTQPGFRPQGPLLSSSESLQGQPGPKGAGGPPRLGYLVAVRGARMAPHLPAGRPFRASAWLEASAGALAVYRFLVESSGGESAAGTLSTYLGGGGGEDGGGEASGPA